MLLLRSSGLTFRVDQCPLVSERSSDSGWKDAAVMLSAKGCIGMPSCGMNGAVEPPTKLSDLVPGDLVELRGSRGGRLVFAQYAGIDSVEPRRWVPRALESDESLLGVVCSVIPTGVFMNARERQALANWANTASDGSTVATLLHVFSIIATHTPTGLSVAATTPAYDLNQRFHDGPFVVLMANPRLPRIRRVS